MVPGSERRGMSGSEGIGLDLMGYKRGFHLPGTPLWFDPERKCSHGVLTALGSGLPPAHQRVIASDRLAGLLQRVGYPSLVLPAMTGQWVGFGGQSISFWDLDSAGIRSAALVAHGSQRIAIMGLIPRGEVRWPQIDHLVARLPTSAPRGRGLETIVHQITTSLQTAKRDRVRLGVVVDSIDVGMALVRALDAAELPVRPVGLLGRCVDGVSSQRGALSIGLRGAPLRAQRFVWVDAGSTNGRPRPPVRGAAVIRLHLDWFCDADAIARIVAQTGASRLTVLPTDETHRDAILTRFEGPVSVRVIGSGRQLAFDTALSSAGVA